VRCRLPTHDARQERRSLRHPRLDGHQDLGGPGPAARYRIARRIEQISGNQLALNQGTLYPALLKLEQAGWISSKWGTSETGRRVRIYALTAVGRKQLHAEEAQWQRAVSIVERFLKISENLS
jgi:PadR family transcriptional regulator